MPELPEVETVRRGLENSILTREISRVEVLHPRATNPKSLSPLEAIGGAQIKNVRRRGKFLWIELDAPVALVAHLGMSGQFKIQPPDSVDEKHLRARFSFTPAKDGQSNSELRFVDQRTFGWLAISEYQDGVPELVSHIALDIFDPNFDPDHVIDTMVKKQSEIKRALLDQQLMSGVGNIYADESLWLAQIHPEHLASELSRSDLLRLLDAVRSVMSQALLEGGTSFDALYINVNGESGYFDRSLEAYGQEDRPCSRCGTPIRRISFAGRSSHFCPACQRR